MELNQKKCASCSKGTLPLKGELLKPFLSQLQEGWHLVEERLLEKEFTFKDFKQALFFTNEVGSLAEEEGHHPDLALSYGKVKIQIWTHKIGGLSENDFILASKIDALPKN